MPVEQAPGASVGDIVEHWLRRQESGAIGDIFDNGTGLVREIATHSATQIETVGTAGDLAEAAEVGSAVGDLSALAGVLVAIAALGIIDILLAFVRVLAAIKIPWIGTRIFPFVDWLYKRVDSLQTAVYGYITQQATGILTGFATLVGWSLSTPKINAGNRANVATSAEVESLNRRTAHLWGWLQHTSERVDNLYKDIVGVQPSVPGHNLTINQLYGHQHAQIVQLEHDNSTQAGQIAVLNANVVHLTGVIEQLVKHVHGVRASGFGVQDVGLLLQDIPTQLQKQETQHGIDIGTLTQSVAQLAPLLALTTYGARGVDNLVRVSDDPCQCPQLPRSRTPGERAGIALALTRFLTDG